MPSKQMYWHLEKIVASLCSIRTFSGNPNRLWAKALKLKGINKTYLDHPANEIK